MRSEASLSFQTTSHSSPSPTSLMLAGAVKGTRFAGNVFSHTDAVNFD